MKTIEEAARDHCNIKKDLIIDEEERYYRDFQKYDGFKAGAEFAQRWISVNDELPKVDEKGFSKNVLVCDDPQDSEDARIGYLKQDYSTGLPIWDNDEKSAYWRPIELK